MHRLLSALTLAFIASGASANYITMSPPAGVSVVNGVLSYQASAADISFANGIRAKILGGVNVGGKSVPIPVAFKYASTATKVAAVFAYGNPALLLLAGASVAYDYYKSHNLETNGSTWFEKRGDSNTTWSANWNYPTQYPPQGSSLAACNAAAVLNIGAGATCTNTRIDDTHYSCQCTSPSYGYYGGISVSAHVAEGFTLDPVTQAEFEAKVGNTPLPYGVPQQLPTPLPVEVPIINPTAVPVPEPEPKPVPVPQPMRVPQGAPQPVPNTNPQQYKSPVIDITPAPTVAEPWRVDATPKEITSVSPTPLPDSEPVPQTEPEGTTSAPKESDLCEKYPEILACAKPELDVPDPDQISNENKDLAITADGGWGPSSGSCPASKTITVQGQTFSMGVGALCDFATMIRPLVIGFAWLSAALIFVGMGRRS